MSGWWSQCPWGKSSAPTERIGSFLTPTGGFGYCRRVFGRSRAPPLRRGVDTVRHLSGFGGGRYPLAGHIGPALRMGVVAVYHTPRLGGGRYRGGADIRPAWVVGGTGVGRTGASAPTEGCRVRIPCNHSWWLSLPWLGGAAPRPYGGCESPPHPSRPFQAVPPSPRGGRRGRTGASAPTGGIDAVRHSCGGGGCVGAGGGAPGSSRPTGGIGADCRLEGGGRALLPGWRDT